MEETVLEYNEITNNKLREGYYEFKSIVPEKWSRNLDGIIVRV